MFSSVPAMLHSLVTLNPTGKPQFPLCLFVKYKQNRVIFRLCLSQYIPEFWQWVHSLRKSSLSWCWQTRGKGGGGEGGGEGRQV